MVLIYNEALYQKYEFMVPWTGVQTIGWGQYGPKVKTIDFIIFSSVLSQLLEIKSCIGIMFTSYCPDDQL